MSPSVGEAAGLTFDGADRQIMSRWRLQYWNKSWNFSNAGGVRKMLLSLGGCFIFTAVCIDPCVSLRCGLMWSISLGSSYFYYLLNFPPLLRVFIFEWNKLSIFVAVGGAPHLTSQMRRKEVVKALWGKCVLELDVLMTEWGGKKKLCSASSQYFDSLVFCRTWMAP